MLFLVAIVATTALALPAAPAEAASGCQTFPSTPYWEDQRVELVKVSNIAACDRVMLVVRSEVEEYVWNYDTASWTQVSAGDMSQSDVSYQRAEAVASCKGRGSGTRFRSRGRATGVWDYSYTSIDGPKWATYYREFECTDGLRAVGGI